MKYIIKIKLYKTTYNKTYNFCNISATIGCVGSKKFWREWVKKIACFEILAWVKKKCRGCRVVGGTCLENWPG